MYAWAVVRLPPVIPSTITATKIIVSELARPSNR